MTAELLRKKERRPEECCVIGVVLERFCSESEQSPRMRRTVGVYILVDEIRNGKYREVVSWWPSGRSPVAGTTKRPVGLKRKLNED